GPSGRGSKVKGGKPSLNPTSWLGDLADVRLVVREHDELGRLLVRLGLLELHAQAPAVTLGDEECLELVEDRLEHHGAALADGDALRLPVLVEDRDAVPVLVEDEVALVVLLVLDDDLAGAHVVVDLVADEEEVGDIGLLVEV